MSTDETTNAPEAPPPAAEAAAGAKENTTAAAEETPAATTMNGTAKPAAAAVATAATNGDAATAAAPAAKLPASPAVQEARAHVTEVDAEDDVAVPDEEGAAEEDAFFSNIEQNEAASEAVAAAQPKDVDHAPALLKKALEKGEVKADQSEEESDKETQKKAASPEKKEPHVHQRGDQLTYLLDKASEYSNFIANDLEELQANMAAKARKSLEKSEKKAAKKRKGQGAGGASKKSKNNDGTAALASAQAKDAASRTKEKGIFVQPRNLGKGCQLKDYQLEGVRWMASLFENGVSGILADEMGLGKTIQCITLIAHLLTQDVKGPFIVVAPLATLPNWVREFEKWLPVRPVIRYHGTSAERDGMLKGPLHYKKRRDENFPFIVTSYEVAIRDQSKLEKLSVFTYMIVDEGHRLKNHRCTLLSSLKRIKAANRLLLTGTPIQNTLNELWSLLNFVNPSIFDDLSIFQSWFGFKDIGQKSGTNEAAIVQEERKNQTVSKLHAILRPFLLRRLKCDVLKDMPPKKEIIVYSGISKLQEGYGKLIDDGTLRDTLISQGIESGRTLSQTNKMMNHRKNINHPFLFGEPVDPNTGVHVGTTHPGLLVTASGKFALLDRMLERLHRDGHQVLIFSQMTSVLSVMEDYLNYRKWNYCRIDGSTNIDSRQQQMDVFNAETTGGVNGTRNLAADRMFVFLLSTRAGGLGINLTAADTCIIFDSDWNPFADSQAMDRCHRLGQTRPVAVYRLITTNSVDIEMMEKQISKKKLERMTIVGGDFRKAGSRSRGEITFEGLQSLLQSDVRDLNAHEAKDVESIKIDDSEFELIMDREKLFATGESAVPTEGKMYDILDAATGDLLGAMNT